MKRKPHRPTVNPFVGTHPDLGFESDDDSWMSSKSVESLHPATKEYLKISSGQRAKETPIFVPLGELSDEQIRALPRAAFTDNEWDSLPKETQKYISEHDEESKARVAAIADPFVSAQEDAESGHYIYGDTIEYIVDEWARRGDDLWEYLPISVINTVQDKAALRGISTEQANEILVVAFQEYLDRVSHVTDSTWDSWTDEKKSNLTRIFGENCQEEVHVDLKDSGVINAWENAFENERDDAIAIIKKKTDFYVSHSDIDYEAKRVREGRYANYFEASLDIPLTFYIDERTASGIQEHALELLEDIEGEEMDVPLPPEERRLYTWPDNFYVMNLTLEEISQEGPAMGHCVGKPSMGYIRAAADGRVFIHSIRRPTGKRLFTTCVERGRKGEVTGMSQLKGKANRLPGFDLGMSGREYWPKIGKDEVDKALHYTINVMGIDPRRVNDLAPAIDAIFEASETAPLRYPEHVREWAVEMRKKYFDTQIKSNPAPISRRAHETDHECQHGQCEGFCVPYRNKW